MRHSASISYKLIQLDKHYMYGRWIFYRGHWLGYPRFAIKCWKALYKKIIPPPPYISSQMRGVCLGHSCSTIPMSKRNYTYDDIIKWKHFPCHWPFVREIHRSPVNSSHKGQWRGALMFPLICTWTNCWVNNRDAGDLRHQFAHYDVIVMWW